MYWSNLSAAANAAAAYQTGQPGYAVSHTPTAAATYTTQRATTGSTYDAAYQPTAVAHTSAATFPNAAASTTYDYGYGRSSQAPAGATVVAYDSTKAYYAQPSSATSYTSADTHFQAKTGYSSGTGFPAASRQTATVVTPKTTTYPATYTGAASAVVGATAANSSMVAGSVNSSYHPTPFNRQSTGGNKGGNAKSGGGGGVWPFKKAGSGQGKNSRPKPPPKPQQLHYCDVCKISCAGPQTYREHLDGQKHKKREASMKVGPTPCRHGTTLRCELCDVTCTGNDAYAAHIRGAKHQKVVKLHQKLGKPIPSTDPVVVAVAGKTTSSISKSGSQSGTTGVAGESKKEDAKEEILELKEKEIEPVGLEYIEEMKDSEVVSFNCKLCECRFNDPNAKEMHMKGRRHRLQYKKKVNPELVVEVKPSLRQRKVQEDKLRRQQLREEMWRRREEERLLEEEERWYWEEQRRLAEECDYFNWGGRYPRGPPGNMPPPMMPPGGPRMNYMPQMMPIRRPDSSDDRHVLSKHAEIFPRETELSSIQKIVSNTEKALKMVSDQLAELDETVRDEVKPKEDPKTKQENKDSSSKDGSETEKKSEAQPRMLKGVMRVGILAKGLLLKGDRHVQLVVLCGDKPTKALLDRVAEALPRKLEAISPNDKYEIHRAVEEVALVLKELATTDPVTVTITLTSPVMREQVLLEHDGESQVAATAVAKDGPSSDVVLDKRKCLEALASLRHAKWFQARANGLQSCVMVIRILRDLRARVPIWSVLSDWAVELICEKVIVSAGQPLSPGDGFRRVLEALSSGLLLPGSPGLLDPCEKDPVDATSALTAQEREDITASAQHALRLIAFRQIHKVLGMDMLPVPKFLRGGPGRFNRKRRREHSTSETNNSDGDHEGSEGKKDKKDKKEVADDKMETEKA